LTGGTDSREDKTEHRQASEWLVLLDSGEATADDRKRFEEWLRESPVHRAEFAGLKETWGRLTTMGERVRAGDYAEPDPDALLERLDRIGREKRRPRAAAWAVAAAVVVAAVLGALLVLPGPDEPPVPYTTGVGEHRTVSLPDGSTVDLNTRTELLVEYTDEQRQVAMRQGEAFFEVVGDASRPFVVVAGHGAIRAVGTGFTVRLKSPDVVSVTVTEGIVEVTHARIAPPDASQAAEPPPTLRSGQRAEYDRQDTRIEAVEEGEVERTQAWRRGLLIFENSSLAEVLDEVHRYTETRLILADPELGELRLGGTFRAGRVAALLEVMEKGFGIEVNREQPNVVMLHASPDTSSRATQ
jgi:transmembrane sensor